MEAGFGTICKSGCCHNRATGILRQHGTAWHGMAWHSMQAYCHMHSGVLVLEVRADRHICRLHLSPTSCVIQDAHVQNGTEDMFCSCSSATAVAGSARHSSCMLL